MTKSGQISTLVGSIEGGFVKRAIQFRLIGTPALFLAPILAQAGQVPLPYVGGTWQAAVHHYDQGSPYADINNTNFGSGIPGPLSFSVGANNGAPVADVFTSNLGGFFAFDAAAAASGGPGFLKAFAAAIGPKDASTAGFGAWGRATAVLNDTVTLSNPGIVSGTPGTVTAKLIIPVSLLFGVDGVGHSCLACEDQWQATMNSFTDPNNVAGTSTTDISVFGQIVRNGGVTITGDPAGGIYVATVPFIWGQPLYFNVSLTAFAANSLTSPLSLGNGDAATDAGHSLYWGGLSGATANGAPVSSFTLTSASGTDYSQSFAPTSAPEPAVGLLTGALLAGLALARRFR